MTAEVSTRLARYLVVGAATNLALLGVFGLLVWLGLAALTATMLVYALGIMVSYLFNRNWSFSSTAAHRHAMPRYVAAYGLGFLVSVLGMWLLHEILGWPAMPVQLGVMLASAALIFWALNAFAFPRGKTG